MGRAVLAVWAAVARHLVADSGALVTAEHLPALMPPLAAVLNRPDASEAAERVRPPAPCSAPQHRCFGRVHECPSR